MFCPKCATPNADDARFCRACGADIGLVPQALSGALARQLDEADESRHGRRRRHRSGKPATVERAVQSLFMGLAFIFVAFAVRTWAPAGHIWWFWMFLPAASLLADGISTCVRLAREEKRYEILTHPPPQAAVPPPRRASALPPRDTGEMIPPPSVTEGTTRHLSVPVERKRGEG